MDTIVIKVTVDESENVMMITRRARDSFWPVFQRRIFTNLSDAEKRSITEKNPKKWYLRRARFMPTGNRLYQPKVEILEKLNKNKDALCYVLEIQCSVPKLLYGNSLLEVLPHDFALVPASLRNRLSEAGITLTAEMIANAEVSGVHFCKNVLLPPDMHMQDIVAVLLRFDISKAVDVTSRKFKQGGQMCHFYSSSTRERIIYDKVTDMMRPKGKRENKSPVTAERDFIQLHQLENLEVFRYEYRLKRIQTVQSCINTALGREHKTLVLFKDILNPELCKTILITSWHSLIDRTENQLSLFGTGEKGSKLFEHVVASAGKGGGPQSLNNALIAYALGSAAHECGVKEVRRVISKYWNKDHPERLTNKIRAAVQLMEGILHRPDTLVFVDTALERYELISRQTIGKAAAELKKGTAVKQPQQRPSHSPRIEPL